MKIGSLTIIGQNGNITRVEVGTTTPAFGSDMRVNEIKMDETSNVATVLLTGAHPRDAGRKVFAQYNLNNALGYSLGAAATEAVV